MSNKVQYELEKIDIPEGLHDRARLGVEKAQAEIEAEKPTKWKKKWRKKEKRILYKRFLLAVAALLIAVSIFTFTPAFAAIQKVYDQIFSTQHIDDTGVRKAVNSGVGQTVDQTFYDKKHGITVHFDRVITDNKETKLLLTFQSKKTNLKNYYLDNFEGKTSVHLIVNGQDQTLNSVGWGSRYYDKKVNKVAEALSFASIKDYAGQDIRLELRDLTIYEEQSVRAVQTTWPLHFKLKKSAVLGRKAIEVNKEFHFKNETYTIKRVEFSPLETRVVVTGSDTKLITDKYGNKYHAMSKLEKEFLNPRKISKEYGYSVDNGKSGVFLKSAGDKVDPIFSKGEVQGAEGEYVMIFAPVKDRQDCVLEVGDDIKIPLTK